MQGNLATLLESSAQRFPDRDAIVLGETRLSYAQLDAAANQVANLLVDRGIEPGDKVALSCPNLPYFTIVYFGILKTGAAVVPLNVLLKGREIAYHLADSDANAYFCFEGTPELPIGAEGYAGFEQIDDCEHFFVITADPAGASPIEGTEAMGRRDGLPGRPPSRPWPPTTTTPPSSSTPPAPPASPRAPSCGTATCGTTRGRRRRCSTPTPTSPDTYLCVLPLFHSFGQTVIQNAAFAFGGTVVMLPRFDAEAALSSCSAAASRSSPASRPCTGRCSAPWTSTASTSPRSPRTCGSRSRAARPCPSRSTSRFEARFGVTILEGYGLSETSPVASFSVFGEPARPGSIGMPINGVADDALEPGRGTRCPTPPTRSARSPSRATTS